MRPVVSLYILNANGHLNHQHELPSTTYIENILKRSLELWLSSLKIIKNLLMKKLLRLKGIEPNSYSMWECYLSNLAFGRMWYYGLLWKLLKIWTELTPSYWQTLRGNVYRRNIDFEGFGNAVMSSFYQNWENLNRTHPFILTDWVKLSVGNCQTLHLGLGGVDNGFISKM